MLNSSDLHFLVDLVQVVKEMDEENETKKLEEMFDTPQLWGIHFARVAELVRRLEHDDFGESFGLFLHFEMHLTIDKIVRLTQAACKRFCRTTNTYVTKELLYHKFIKSKVPIHVPRIAPPRSKLEPLKNQISAKLGLTHSEDGSMARIEFDAVIQQLLAQDPGTGDMPALPFFMGGAVPLPLVVSKDATGYGSLQFNTFAVRNPYASKAAARLRVFGLGNCSDDRVGSTALLGPNLAQINRTVQARREGHCLLYNVNGVDVSVMPHVFFVDDVSCLRHCEHLAASGWCTCTRDEALRASPNKPRNEAELMCLMSECHSPTARQRFIRSHNPLPGHTLPEPCDMCNFAHDRSNAASELAELYAEEARLAGDTSKRGKAAFSKWRMAFASVHGNIQPGLHGRPMTQHDLDDQLLDPLHYSKLGIPKTPWKHGILNNASDDARQQISDQLARWKHPLDTRRKDDGRNRAQKWFTGERWHTFCAGERGSPGGPIAIATLVHIVAEDLQKRGVDEGASIHEPEEAPAKKVDKGKKSAALVEAPQPKPQRKKTSRRAAFQARARAQAQQEEPEVDEPEPVEDNLPPDVVQATPVELQHTPTALEEAADPEDLKIIRELYGSRAQTLINVLLSFDGYFNWYYPLEESIPFMAPYDQRVERALSNCQLAIDMNEIFERVTIRSHGSFLPHAAIFKVSKDILTVGDVWATDLSPLEMQNADTKRTATSIASRRMKLSAGGFAAHPLRGKHEGPAQLVETKGYSTTMAISTLKGLLSTNYLRKGDGIIAIPDCRRVERLFGKSGRMSLGSSGFKIAMSDEYNYRNDTCIKAFIRILAQKASEKNE